jgi:hypothetical protein
MVLASRRAFQNAVVFYFALGLGDALAPPKGHINARVKPMMKISKGEENNGIDEEVFIYDQASRLVVTEKDSSTKANYMDDLTPPPINLARDSILFDENPSTRSNNGGLNLWQWCKTNLPAVFTGAWPWRDAQVADDNPIGGLYNIAFVRLPVILVGVVYTNNLIGGHPLVVDIGQGPFEMSPLAVFAVLALILA